MMSGSLVCETMPVPSENSRPSNDLRQTRVLEADTPTGPPDGHSLGLSSPTSLVEAIAAAKVGNRPLARLHLEQAIQSEPENPIAWLWFAWVADSPAAAISSLEQAQKRGSTSALVQPALTWMRGLQEFELETANADLTQDQAPSNQQLQDVSSQRRNVTMPLPKTAQPANDGGRDVRSTTCLQQGPDAHETSGKHNTSTEDALVDSIGRDLNQIHGDVALSNQLPEAASSQRPNVTMPLPNTGHCEKVEGYEAPSIRDLFAQRADPQEAMAEQYLQSEGSTVDSADDPVSRDLEAIIEGIESKPQNASFPAVEVDEAVGEPPSDALVRPDLADLTKNAVASEGAIEDDASSESRPIILAVDDSPTVRGLVKISLEKCGYKVVTAEDGIDATKRLNTVTPSLILLDINMPRLNGYMLCKMLKDFPPTRSIPVIMLSGKDGMFDKFRGKMSGCDDYITKPFEATELQEKVAEHLAIVGEPAV